MGNVQRIAAWSCAGVLLSVNVLAGRDALRLQVSPLVARAPASVTVRVTLQPTADDRYLRVIAESPTYYRSSEVELEGAKSSPVQVFEFRNLTAGVYQITAVLVGRLGPRATALRLANIAPPVGSQ